MPHRGAAFPVAAVHDIGLFEIGGPVRHVQFAVVEFEQMLDLFAAAVGREPHQLAAFVPVAKNVGRGAAVERAQPRHGVELVAEKAAIRLHPDLLQAFEFCAAELVIALGFTGERRRRIGRWIGLHDVGLVAADAVDNHHYAFVERRGRKRAVGVCQMVRDRHHLVRLRQI